MKNFEFGRNASFVPCFERCCRYFLQWIEDELLVMLYSPILCIVTCFQEINDRMEYLINKIVRQITAHAESLHEEVEVMAKVGNNQLNITTRKHSSRMLTVRLCSSGGKPFPTTWMPYASEYPIPKYVTPLPTKKGHGTRDQEGTWHQRYPNPAPNIMIDTRLWKHYLPTTIVAGGV